jgi:hypothetical protein
MQRGVKMVQSVTSATSHINSVCNQPHRVGFLFRVQLVPKLHLRLVQGSHCAGTSCAFCRKQ